MLRNAFVFDGAFHIMDMSLSFLPEGDPGRDAEAYNRRLDAINRLTGGIIERTWNLPEDAPPHVRGNVEANYDLAFVQGVTDMALVGNVAFNLLEAPDDPNYGLRLNHALAAAYPGRVLFGGGTDPLTRGLDYALESIEYQIRELGAVSMKFYPFEWDVDDQQLAYPMYEKCRSLGVDVLQFHMCLPGAAHHRLERQAPFGLQAPAIDFPDMTFVMHHVQKLYFQETLNIAARNPNIHLLIAPLLHQILTKPRLVQHLLGEMLAQIGSERLCWGSEGSQAGNTRWVVEAFMDFAIPDDLLEGYGYPQVTDEDRANILGLNLARMFGVDVPAKLTEFAADEASGS